jgi:hypothetical protein
VPKYMRPLARVRDSILVGNEHSILDRVARKYGARGKRRTVRTT